MLRALICCAVLSATVSLTPVAARADDPAPAEADTLAPNPVGQTSATFRATVAAHGLPTKVRFEYGTTEETTQATPDVEVIDGSPVAVPVTGLAPASHYYVVARAENEAGGEYGSVVEFDTRRVPVVAVQPPTDVGPLSATLHVQVTGYGLPVTVTAAAQEPAPLRRSPLMPPIAASPVTVTTDGDVALPLGGLQPNTLYRVSATATSPVGTATAGGTGRAAVADKDVTFRTAPLRGLYPPRLSTPVAVYGSQVTLTGSLPGDPGVPVALHKQPFPFTGSFMAVAGATTTTDATGAYRFTVPVFEHARYAVAAPGYFAPMQGTSAELRVSAVVTTRVVRARRGRSVVSGRFMPDVPARVSLFRVGHGRVVEATTRASGTTGRAFRFAPRALKPGTYEVRITMPKASGLRSTHSAPFRIPARR